MEDRYYDEWNEVKKKLQTNGKIFQFREKEIWWYAAGENIGSEISGKSLRFSRPILIFRKYGKTTFLAFRSARDRAATVFGTAILWLIKRKDVLYYLRLGVLVQRGYIAR